MSIYYNLLLKRHMWVQPQTQSVAYSNIIKKKVVNIYFLYFNFNSPSSIPRVPSHIIQLTTSNYEPLNNFFQYMVFVQKEITPGFSALDTDINGCLCWNVGGYSNIRIIQDTSQFVRVALTNFIFFVKFVQQVDEFVPICVSNIGIFR